MRLIILAIITVVVATASGLLSNILANKIQPHIENKTRLLIISFCVLLVAGIVITAAEKYIPSEPDKPPISDNLKITSVKTIEDSETQIQPLANQGVISVFWEVMLSNVGNTSLSITSYQVRQVGEDFPAVMYSGMNQGMYVFEKGKFKTLDLPIELTAGNTRKVFVRLGLLMTPESYKLIKENFTNSSPATLKTIWHFLFTKGTDFYGNKIEPLPEKTGYTFPSIDQIHEQVFVISLKTSRDASVEELLSWYKYGGGMDMRRHQ
jgi:hypothetical protein